MAVSITHTIKNDFYNDYIYNKKFVEIFNLRKSYIKKKFILNNSDEEMIKEYFVEIFSWTVLDNFLLNDIYDTIQTYLKDICIIDPCSGNSFHTFLFNNFLNIPVITIDIQPEENAWIETIEYDGLEYIKNMEEHNKKILLLSWIDYTNYELPYNLLTNFKGKVIISIGNYREINCQKYIDELKINYKLVKEYYCNMPWGFTEEIKIYIR
jgi:hypothetical protein